MEECELDLIPKMRRQGRMSKREAVMKMLMFVYTNPGRFNLLDMGEDERSDFLLDALPRFARMLDRYKDSLGPLGAYLFYSMPGIRMTWTRKKAEDAAAKKATKRSLRNLYEIEQEGKNSALAAKEEEGLKIRDAGEAPIVEPLIFKRVLGRRANLLEPKEKFYKKRAALILALKSAWYLDEASLEKVSGYCGFSSESVRALVSKIKDGLEERRTKRTELELRRDKAWHFVCKYREMLLEIDPSSERFKSIKRKLEYQLNSWKKKTKILQSCQMTLAPKNKDLAKILKMKPYRISVLIGYAKKMAASGETLFPVQP